MSIRAIIVALPIQHNTTVGKTSGPRKAGRADIAARKMPGKLAPAGPTPKNLRLAMRLIAEPVTTSRSMSSPDNDSYILCNSDRL
jgi:hypothetical protein